MDSRSVLYPPGRNDEHLTPPWGVTPIVKYIPRNATIWCPFDRPNSHFVQILSQTHTVTHSHIDEDRDFYEYEPPHWDVIISNPPFTRKRQIFERAISFNKPFALIMSNTWLNDAAPKQLFRDIDLQLLMFDRRIEFISDSKVKNKVTFSSSYYCRDLLPKQIIMEELPKH